MQLKIGQLYKCKWCYRSQPDFMGWDMIMFLGTETVKHSHDECVTSYLFHDVLQGERRLLDEGLIRFCKELNLEEL